MILAISAYSHPFRAILLEDNLSIHGIYYPSADKTNKADIYDFPFQSLIDKLLAENMDLTRIDTVLVLGKPLRFFENLILECLWPPSLKKVARFGRGVAHYFGKNFRIKRDIDATLRHKSAIFFIDTIHAHLSASSLFNLRKKIFLWAVNTEDSPSALINLEDNKVIFLNRLKGEYLRYKEESNPQDKISILQSVLTEESKGSNVVITNRVDGLANLLDSNIRLCFDAPTFALIGCCDIYLTGFKDHEMVKAYRCSMQNMMGFSDSGNDKDPPNRCIFPNNDEHTLFKEI